MNETKPVSPDLRPMRTVSILGATGSVGQATLDVLAQAMRDPTAPHRYVLSALSGHRNIQELHRLAWAFQPRFVGVSGVEARDRAMSSAVSSLAWPPHVQLLVGPDAATELAQRQGDWLMVALVGLAGLGPILAGLATHAVVAVVNKEPLVAAGPMIMETARHHGSTVVPVDSEHNAVWQILQPPPPPQAGQMETPNPSPGDTAPGPGHPESIEKIFLTASGGPFLDWSPEKIRRATVQEALAHPNWSMGRKISVDSATMVNKGLEIIEASHLFGLEASRIEVLIHPQQLIHALVSYEDGSLLAHMGAPDMRIPIAYSLYWPRRHKAATRRIDWSRVFSLEFRPPDMRRFPALALAREALARGPSACLALSAANEAAVEAFLAGDLDLWTLPQILGRVLEQSFPPAETLADCLTLHAATKRKTEALIKTRRVVYPGPGPSSLGSKSSALSSPEHADQARSADLS